MRLSPQLVPKPLWRISGAQQLTRAAWEQIRQDEIHRADNRCEVCHKSPQGKGDYLICHEVWDYEDQTGRATLTRFEIHCRACDLVTHMGRAKAHGYFEAALERLSHINNLTEEEARQVFDGAMALWRERNKVNWQVTVNKDALEKYPQLATLDGQKFAAKIPAQPRPR
jgi:hypothetical protein